jgi:F0F1-type ATP synthase gamma subunit
MATITNINNELSFFDTVKTVLCAYQEVALMKMQESRDSVVVSRQYLEELGYVYFEVKFSYKKELQKMRSKDKNSSRVMKKAVVLLTPNEKLSGTVTYDVFRAFLDYVRNNGDAEVIIVGNIGQALISRIENAPSYQFFELLYGETFEEDVVNLAYLLKEYDDVVVFHGRFESLVSQRAATMPLSGDAPPEVLRLDAARLHGMRKTNFLFEPRINDIVAFFDSQVKAALLRQSVHESRLAQFASRARAMDEALGHVQTQEKILGAKYRHLIRQKKDKSRLGQLSTVIWALS